MTHTIYILFTQLWSSICKLSLEERQARGFTRALNDQIDRRINVAALVKSLGLK